MTSDITRVEQGTLQGVTSRDGSVRSYKGVPFARPPVGELRWRSPQPPDGWDGIRPADAFAPHAFQPPIRDNILLGSYVGGSYGEPSEDCLYLNIWTAPADRDERRPVMVWFHHGAFRFGGPGVPLYDGENLARDGAVVVTVAYRLGRLGFMAHPELSAESGHGASGNYGLQDEIRALEWIQENIAAFGGDPDCVTVFGLSAGSASVNLLMASPLARGLFQRAIGESGALMTPAAPSSGRGDRMQDLGSAEQTGLALGRALGCGSLDELRRCPAGDVIAVPALKLLAEPPPDTAWLRAGMPVHAGELDGNYPVLDGYVLPRTPFEIYSSGGQADVPLLTGSAAREASGLPYITDLEAWTTESRSAYGEFADRFLSLFAATDGDVREISAASLGDRVFIWQNWTWARLHARTANSPAFYYHWSHVPPIHVDEEFADRTRGAFHGVELPYIFRNLEVHDWPWEAFDRSLRDVVSSYWLNFARTGDPNGDTLPEWPTFDPDAPRAMHFAEEIAVGPVPRREQLDFWDDWYGAMRTGGASTPSSETATAPVIAR